MLVQPVEGWEISPSTLTSIRPRARRWTSLLYLRFVLLQPVEATLEALEIRESTLETLEIRPTLETLELLALETLALLESPSPLRQAWRLLQPLALLQWQPKMMQPPPPR